MLISIQVLQAIDRIFVIYFFVMENVYSFESEHNFLFDLFQNCNWLENRRLIEKLKVFSNL